MRTLTTLVLTVLAGMLVSVVGLYVVRLIVPLEMLKANNDVGGNYLQTLGTVYAVLLAFVVFVVWTQQNETDKLVERGADELADVLRIVRSFPEPARSRIQQAAREYACEVIENEWPAMARRSASPRAAQLLDSVWIALAAFEPQTAKEQALFGEVIARFNDLCDARTDLLHSSRMRLPPTLWILLVTGGLSIVASMYLFGLDLFWPHAIMTASMAGSVSFVMFLIQDLDTPFSGDWQVTPEPIRLVVEQLGRQMSVSPPGNQSKPTGTANS